MVPNAPKNEHQESSSSPNWQNLRKKITGRVSCIDKKKEIKIGCMVSFTQQLAAKVISKRASKLVKGWQYQLSIVMTSPSPQETNLLSRVLKGVGNRVSHSGGRGSMEDAPHPMIFFEHPLSKPMPHSWGASPLKNEAPPNWKTPSPPPPLKSEASFQEMIPRKKLRKIGNYY